MPYYSNTPLQQNNNTSTQQNRITPMLQYVIITLHQTPDCIGISAPIICPRQRKVVPLYQRGHHRQATGNHDRKASLCEPE